MQKLVIALSLVLLQAISLLVLCVFAQSRNFTVTVITKTAAHPTFGFPGGISSGYAINGVEGATLTLEVGVNYTFVLNNVGCFHPFYFTRDSNGGGTPDQGSTSQQVVDGTDARIIVPFGNYSNVCGTNNIVYFMPLSPLTGRTIYYECRFHRFMGWKINIVPETFCNKYTRLTNSPSQQALITTVLNSTSPPGVMARLTDPNAITRSFFDGTEVPGSRNFVCGDATCQANYNDLLNSLVAFFGMVLGCNDPNFPRYTRSTDLALIHKSMPIDPIAFDFFNQQVEDTLVAFGVQAADVAFVRGYLNSTRIDICNCCGCRTSICDRYSDALGVNNRQLVTDVVLGVVNLIVANDSPIRKYFDGSNGGTNFLTNTNALNTLVSKLVAVFGAALGCTDAVNGTGTYTPPPPATDLTSAMAQVHYPLNIPKPDSDFFNNAVITVLAGAGVSPVDQNAVRALLQSLEPFIVNSNASQPNVAQTFTVDVVPKVNHPFVGRGFSSGFTIDGVEGKLLNVTPGLTYKFVVRNSCIHPFYLADNEQGASQGEITDGVSAVDYTLVCNDASMLWTVPQSRAGTTIYYGCRNHLFMGYQIAIGGTPPPPPASTPPPTPAGTPPPTRTSNVTMTTMNSLLLVVILVIAILF